MTQVDPDLNFRAHDQLAEQLYWLALCYRKSLPARWSVRTQAQHERHRRSVMLLQTLVRYYPFDQTFQYELARTLSHLDEFAPEMQYDTLTAVIEDLKQAVQLADSLNERFPSITSYQVVALRANFKLAHLCSRDLDQLPATVARQQQDQLKNQAERSFRRALWLQRDLVTQNPESEAYRVWAALIAIRNADFLNDRGQPDKQSRLIAEAQARLQNPPIDRQEHPSVEPILAHAQRLSFRFLTTTPSDQQ